jgi:hypothetical protein
MLRAIVYVYAGITTILLGGVAGARLLLGGGKDLTLATEGIRRGERSVLSGAVVLLAYVAVGLCLLPVALGIVLLGLTFLDVSLTPGHGLVEAWALDRLFYGYLSAPLALCFFNTSLLLALLIRARGWGERLPRPLAYLGIASWVLAFFFLWATVGLWLFERQPEFRTAPAWLPWLGGAVVTALSLAIRWLQEADRKRDEVAFSLVVLGIATGTALLVTI